jgi:Replicase family.
MTSHYQPDLFAASLPRWLTCSDDPQQWGVQSLPREKATKRAYIDPNPQALVWALVFDIDRPGAAMAWQDANAPRPNWITQNPRNAHAHLGYMLAAPVPRTLKARATPQRFLARIQHGLTLALDADRAYTHRLTKTPTMRAGGPSGSAGSLTSWGSYATTSANVCRCVSHGWKR